MSHGCVSLVTDGLNFSYFIHNCQETIDLNEWIHAVLEIFCSRYLLEDSTQEWWEEQENGMGRYIRPEFCFGTPIKGYGCTLLQVLKGLNSEESRW